MTITEFETDQNHPFRVTLRDNDLWDWTPQAPMFIYHGLADEIVPVENSIITYDHFIANGAGNVTLELLPEYYGGHSEAAIYCLIGAFAVGETMAKTFEKGDVTADETINVLDIVLTINIILENWLPSDFEIWAADVNEDENLDVLDVVGIINLIMGD